ncbi:L,D-transpeptidase catalytic domain [Granulicella rosea]|uniref:L,D-transpeptidase catalytic domain n=1 Tax=Granulicella rosea TaxID=474952 RepID=A0A239GS57_9BACT|nr:L,D-transpeptidase [Granulicella rosea]SNS71715.1 L,D-transpeptidase catalytic domain [Granulicella rosea]
MKIKSSRRIFLWNGFAGLAVMRVSTSVLWSQESLPLGPMVALDIEGLKPGQFLWAPAIAPSGPVLAVISLGVQRCYVYRNGVLIGVATVSTGKTGHRTPTGVFTILQKQVHHKSSLYKSAPMPYMERLTWSGVAMHAGNLPGYPASHGCIRMPIAFARLLYGTTEQGMTVVITELDAVPRIAPTPDLLQGEAATKAEDAGGAIWEPQKSTSGLVSLVLSAADRRLVVLRNGVLIGSTPVTIAGSVAETTAYSLSKIDQEGFHWIQLPLPGQSWEGSRELPLTERARVTMPDAFRSALDGLLSPGVTLVVTADSLLASATGNSLTVIESEP